MAMAAFLLPLLLLLSLVFILGGLYVASQSFTNASSKKKIPDPEPEVEVHKPQTRNSRGGTGRMRLRRRHNEPSVDSGEGSSQDHGPQEGEGTRDHGGADGEGDNDNDIANNSSNPRELTKKELKKKQKEAKRQSEIATREARAEKSETYSEKQRKKEEEREEQERKKAEELQKKKEKDEKEAEEELDKWKTLFSVENEGTVEEAMQEEDQGLLTRFVDYIKMNKCVDLEDLGAEFGLRTQDVIARVQALEQMGRLTGVMDDRGKFIFITLEEMKAVAEYIEQKGRVSIAHLANKSNEFIDLEPKSVIDFKDQQEEEDTNYTNDTHAVKSSMDTATL